MIQTLAVANYRSLRRLVVPLRELNLITGANGSGKSNVYLLWIAALLTPRPSALLVLNEPETSLHPDLLPALARLVAQASCRAQVLVVSHSAPLIEAFGRLTGGHTIRWIKELGETRVDGLRELDEPPWHWPPR